METKAKNVQECCPEFIPAPWDDKQVVWENKKFIRDKVFTIFYMPMNFGQVMKRLDKKVREAGACMPDGLCLSDHTSGWNMDLYLAVDKEVPGTVHTEFSGKFYTRVYEGPYKDTGKWSRDFEENVKAKNLKTGKMYTWYTTCPKCAKKHGKNYVVIMAPLQ